MKKIMHSLKNKVYNTIRDDDINDLLSNIVDSTIVILIIINVIKIFLDTFVTIRPYIEPYYDIINTISIIVFSIEYILRIWTADLIYTKLTPTKARLKYIFTPKSLIDFISLVSFYLPLFVAGSFEILRIVRLFRILSLLKINRYSKSLTVLGNVIRKKGIQLISSFFIVFVLMIFASLLMYYIENMAQPDLFENAFSSLWWVIATLTTVGYGDMYPVTIFGRLLGILISLMGIGLIAIPTGIISSGFRDEVKENKKSEKHYRSYYKRKRLRRKRA